MSERNPNTDKADEPADPKSTGRRHAKDPIGGGDPTRAYTNVEDSQKVPDIEPEPAPVQQPPEDKKPAKRASR